MTTMSETNHNSGQLHIADDVIASIAGTAALEAEGITGLVGKVGKKVAKGVSLQVDGKKVAVTIAVVARNDAKLQAAAADVQQKVKIAIETMTGYTVAAVNVNVSGLSA